MAADVMVSVGYAVWTSVGRHVGYLVHYKRNVESLKQDLDNLYQVRESAQALVGAASLKGEDPPPEISRWLLMVKDITEQVENFLEEIDKVNFKFLPEYARLSKRAIKMTLMIFDLLREGRFYVLSKSTPDSERQSAPPWIAFENSVIEDVLEALKDERVNTIGIYGMAGVGKTTLVRQVAKQAVEQHFFDGAVVVSQSHSTSHIQNEIAKALHLSFEVRSQAGRAAKLRERLMQSNRTLIVLDAAVDTPDLSAMGIPVGNECGSKLIVTTRLRTTCQRMGTQKDFHVQTLSERDAWNLFNHVAGDHSYSPDLKPIVREVVLRCGGLPLAIVSIGRELKNRKKIFWDGALFQLKNPDNNILLRDVFAAMKLSYTLLKKEEAMFLLLCCLFPENRDIAIEDLFRHGLGLGLFQEAITLKENRRKAEEMANSIKDVSLFADSDKIGYVKMSYLVRCFAMSVAASSEEYHFVLHAGSDTVERPQFLPNEKCRGILIASNVISELPDSLMYEDLKILVIQQNNLQLKIPDPFFCYLEKLLVLVLVGMKSFLVPSSFRLLVNLRTLHLNRCKLTSRLPLRTFRSLEILSFSDSHISDLPVDIRHLSSLRLVDLTNCEFFSSVLLDILSTLPDLEELYLGNLVTRGNIKKTVERRHVNNPWAKSSLCRVLRMRDNYTLGKLFLSPIVSCLVLQVLEICDNHEMEEIVTERDGEEAVADHKKLISWPEILVLQNLPNLTSFFPANFNVEWPSLKQIRVENCPRMRIFALGNMVQEDDLVHLFAQKVVLPCLEELYLIHLDKLMAIWQGLPSVTSFTKLRVLELDGCGELVCVVPFHMTRTLGNLEKIVARNCLSLREACQFADVEGQQSVNLPMLRTVTLANLPELVDIWKGPTQTTFCQNLSNLTVSNCKKLKFLFSSVMVSGLSQLETLSIDGCEALEEIIEREGVTVQPLRFKKLKILQVLNCNSLKLSLSKCLVELQELKVCGCWMVQSMLVDEEDEGTDEKNIFPRLSCIVLKGLPNLTCFYPGFNAFEWPSLETVRMKDCGKMTTFSSRAAQITPKLKAVEVSFIHRLWMGDINATVAKLFELKWDVSSFLGSS